MGVFRSRRHHVQKKSRHASEQDRADIARRRERWKKYQGRLEAKRLVFIDETWAKTNMTRRHGRCARGTRLIAKVPQARWRTLTPAFAGAGSSWRHCAATGSWRPVS
jgi:hypothetical protein